MRHLRAKMIAKAVAFPGELDLSRLDKITTFQEFDDLFTAPLHGFGNAANYWKQNSCITRLHKIHVSTLILSALDDPFLAPACYPTKEAAENSYLTLEPFVLFQTHCH